MDEAGKRLCTMTGFNLARHMISITPPVTSARYDMSYQATEHIVEPRKVNSPLPDHAFD